MSIQEAWQTLGTTVATCTECGVCICRCEVLDQAENSESGCSVGCIARKFMVAFDALDGESLATPEGGALALRAVARIAEEHSDVVFAVRRCCMCGFCTVDCPAGVDARATFAALRELFTLSGVVSGAGFELTQVDTEWHIFSVYRAVYSIFFQDLPHLVDARERGADALFFPGCPLASYAPNLAREVYAWLGEQGIQAVFSEDCCGSPLKAAGRMDRAAAHKQSLMQAVRDSGVRRIVCVCPGCVDELSEVEGFEDIEIVPLPRLLIEAGVRADSAKIRASVRSYAEANTIVDGEDVRVAVADSCHDRAGLFGRPLRTLFENEQLVELCHRGDHALCCGASGAVSLVDSALSARRAHRVLDDEASQASADILVANCPTCSYTFAAQRRADANSGVAWLGPAHMNYLELVFDASFEWDTIFSQLEGMWTGEYGAWVCQVLS